MNHAYWSEPANVHRTKVLVRLILALVIAASALAAVAVQAPPGYAQQFGTAEDCVHEGAHCLPSGNLYLEYETYGDPCSFTVTVNWGDGTSDTFSYSTSTSLSHQYQAPGLYTVSDSGTGTPIGHTGPCTWHPSSFLVEVPSPDSQPPEVPELPDEGPTLVSFLEKTWDRTDKPVQEGRVNRTWMWGPWLLPNPIVEPYIESPGGERDVAYSEKSRMEVSDPGGDQDSIWYVTNGLLVVEMVDGKYQIGDGEFDHSPEPADVPIAGDPVNPDAPTYADINSLGLRDAAALEEGTLITQTIRNGETITDNHYAQFGVTASYRVQVDHIDHTVASVFWDFMNSDGLVYENGDYVTGKLFINPFYATGLPITEAYWATILVGGESTEVLWQCFERRCLTYNPANDAGWQVEAANVGQHYYYWRYGERPWE